MSLKPSTANTWAGHCPGSVSLGASSLVDGVNIYDTGDEESNEGVGAHEFAARQLMCTQHACALPVKVGDVSSNGTVCDASMPEAIQEYAEYVANCLGQYLNPRVWIEDSVQCTKIHPTCKGIPDFACYCPVKHELTVIDFKYGHRAVEVYKNWQTIIYAAGLLEEILKASGFKEERILKITCVIVQPRASHRDGPIREWKTNSDDLRPKWEHARKMAHEALSAEPRCITGPGCGKCFGRHNCETLARAAGNAMDFTTTEGPRTPTGEQAAIEWVMLARAERMIKARKDAMGALVEHSIRGGQRLAAVDCSHGTGRQTWSVDDETVKGTALCYPGVVVTKPAPLITPKQAVKAGLPQSLVDSFSHTPSTGLKITEASAEHARFIFSQES